jgi:peptidyl-dipeptidase Dcp
MLQHTNPLLQPWDTPFELPPFDRIRTEHFAPAFKVAIAEHVAEVAAIAGSREAPTFENTVAALDRSGRQLTRIAQVFFNLASSETSPALQAAERDVAPRIAAHRSAVFLNAALFARVDGLHRRRSELALDDEQGRLLDRTHLDFVMSGATLEPLAKARLAQIVERLAELQTAFAQNVLADESDWVMWLRTEDDLAGLPASVRDAARSVAVQRGEPQAWAITTSRSLVVPFLTFSDRRDLRQQAHAAWKTRGEHAGDRDNRPVAQEILKLRTEQAGLMGYANYADYALVDRMAGTPGAVHELLNRVWEPAKAKARQEHAALAAQAAALGHATDIEAWDWRYLAEKVRQENYDVDDAQVKPYFALERVAEAAFDCAHRLFGIRFVVRPDLGAYHPDVRVYEVQRGDRTIAIFLHDNFARPSKRSGAWMSAYRWQSRASVEVIPIVVNNNNFAKAPEGEPTLLSMDDVRTLFHEFGHGLHGMLSDVTFEGLSGTKVLRDFVELPSQLFEHWILEPAVLKRHARHVRTGEPIPDDLIDRLKRSRQFNQGFETVGYTACALLDLELHARTDPDGIDITEFERVELQRIGMPPGTDPYHRLPHFQHLFAGSSYAAGYYVYMWAEVLDADGYEAFTETGDPFDPSTAARLLKYVFSAGNRVEPRAAYRAFRGRDAAVAPMLAKRGLAPAAA